MQRGCRVGMWALAWLALAMAAVPASAQVPALFRCAPPQADPEATFPYPFPPDPAASGARTDAFEWNGLGGGDNGSFQWGGLDVRSGKVTLRQVVGSWVKRIDARAFPSGTTQTGEEVGRANDVWSWNGDPSNFAFNAFVNFSCLSAPCGGQIFTNHPAGSLSGRTSIDNPPFDPTNPDAYPQHQYGGVAGTFSVQTTFVPGNGTVTLLNERADVTVSLARPVSPWVASELLAGRIQPQVLPLPPVNGTARNQMVVPNPQPRFGFTIDQTGHTSQYHHFNYYQELVAYRINSTGPNDGLLLTSAQLRALPTGFAAFPTFGRGYGPDPLQGGQFGQPADTWPLYWDEDSIAGRNGQGGSVDYRWQARTHGTFFQDIPALPLEGHRATYIAYLVGVRNDGFCDVLARQGIPNANDFVFRWSYLQRRRNAPPGSGLFIPRLENADASVFDSGEGDVFFEGFGEGDVVAVGPEGGFDVDGDGVGDETDTCPGLPDPEQRDEDGDGVGDLCDNCRVAANPTQMDGDFDGFGNVCDADLDNDGNTSFSDLAALKQVFFSSDPVADLDENGVVNFGDLSRMKQLFFRPPGPNGMSP